MYILTYTHARTHTHALVLGGSAIERIVAERKTGLVSLSDGGDDLLQAWFSLGFFAGLDSNARLLVAISSHLSSQPDRRLDVLDGKVA